VPARPALDKRHASADPIVEFSRADRDDASGDLVTKYVPGFGTEFTPPRQGVVTAHSACTDPDQELARSGLRYGHLIELER
jgi:hypothetical protein